MPDFIAMFLYVLWMCASAVVMALLIFWGVSTAVDFYKERASK